MNMILCQVRGGIQDALAQGVEWLLVLRMWWTGAPLDLWGTVLSEMKDEAGTEN